MDVKGICASFVITVLIFAKGYYWKCSVFQLNGQLVLHVINNQRSAVSKLIFLQPFLEK